MNETMLTKIIEHNKTSFLEDIKFIRKEVFYDLEDGSTPRWTDIILVRKDNSRIVLSRSENFIEKDWFIPEAIGTGTHKYAEYVNILQNKKFKDFLNNIPVLNIKEESAYPPVSVTIVVVDDKLKEKIRDMMRTDKIDFEYKWDSYGNLSTTKKGKILLNINHILNLDSDISEEAER